MEQICPCEDRHWPNCQDQSEDLAHFVRSKNHECQSEEERREKHEPKRAQIIEPCQAGMHQAGDGVRLGLNHRGTRESNEPQGYAILLTVLNVERKGPILNLTLNRPEVRNAINDELIAALTESIRGVQSDVRAVVIRGAGPGFCAGGDLEWMRKAASYTEEQNYEDALRVADLFRSVTECHAVVVSLVHGAAFGGGSGLVAASDIAIAHPESKFSFSEVKLGLIPATISPFVIDKIGRGNARALFVTGEPFGAEHALRIGLVHEVAEDLEEAVAIKLKHILMSGPKAVSASKQLTVDDDLSTETTARRLARARAGDEGKEGVAAFLEKRKASFVEEAAAL